MLFHLINFFLVEFKPSYFPWCSKINLSHGNTGNLGSSILKVKKSMKRFHCITHILCNILSHSKFSQNSSNPLSTTYPFASCSVLGLAERHRYLSFYFSSANMSMQGSLVTHLVISTAEGTVIN